MRHEVLRLINATAFSLVLAVNPASAGAPRGGMDGIMNEAFNFALEDDAASKATDIPDLGNTYFEPDPKISRKVREKFVNFFITKMPEKEQELRRVFGQMNMLETSNKEAVEYGYKPNDLTVAISTWITLAFCILEDRETTREEDRAVWRQIRYAFSKSSDLAGLSNEKKQAAAETFLWMAALAYYDYERSKGGGSPKYSVEVVKEYVRGALIRYSFDPDRITITENGLTPIN